MPVHDWKGVYAGLFHHFHQNWISNLTSALNAGRLPTGFYALTEQYSRGPYPDILTLERGPEWTNPASNSVALIETPPQTRFQSRTEVDGYAAKADRIAIHNPLGDVIAVIEIISPGNKSNRENLRKFVKKAIAFIRHGIHVLIVDLFPPSKRDPQGLHKIIWDRFLEVPFELPSDKPLTLASYSAGVIKGAYVEPIAVGDVLPDMPLFLESERHLPVPLEATYLETWKKCPEPFQRMVLGTPESDN